jgi:pyruvate formate lyase activating enzyme
MKLALQKTSLIDYPGKLSCVFFLPGCNLRCPFCHNPGLVEMDRYPELNEGLVEMDEAFAYAEKRKKVIEAVVISGGEPCMRDDLPEMIGFVKSLGLLVKVDTNGLFPEKIQSIDADFVAMDIKTSIGRYPEIPGAGGNSSEKIRLTIQALRKKGIEREFRTTLAPGFAGLAEAVEIAQGLADDENYVLQRFRPGITLDPEFCRNEATSDTEGAAILDAVKRVHANTRLR